jgi:hypothetical protein
VTRFITVFLLLALPIWAQDLTEKNVDDIRDFILPSKAESSWKSIPWRSTLWEGVVDAQEEDKPILFWAMNGHPLACT